MADPEHFDVVYRINPHMRPKAQVNTAGAACSGWAARHPSMADPVAGTQQQHDEKPVLWQSVMSCAEAKYGVVGTVQAGGNKEQQYRPNDS